MFDSDSSCASDCEVSSSPQLLSQEAAPQRGSRPARKRKLPPKLRELEELGDLTDLAAEELRFDQSRSVLVKCAQTGKQYTVKVKALSREDGEALQESNFVKGASLMLEHKGKSYPVRFVSYADNKEKGEGGARKLKDTTNTTKSVLMKAKAASKQPTPKRCKIADENTGKITDENTCTFLDQEDKDLLLDLAKKVEGMEKMLQKMYAFMKTSEACKATVKQEGASATEDEDFTVNGINLLRIPARDAYAYGLNLLDSLFSKEELSTSLLFKSKKSEKPGLDSVRVEKLLACIDKRYGSTWDLKTLASKANQKCRDTKM